MSYTYLFSLAVILLSTKLLSMGTGRLQLPQVVGSLLAGLIFGPAVLGVIQPSEFLSQLSELGVIVIMFTAGMGTSLKDLRSTGPTGFMVALCGVLVPLFMGAGLLFVFQPGAETIHYLFMGTVLTATSVSITVETLKEMGQLSTKVGNTILAAALIDDVLGLICLTVVSSLGGEGSNLLWVLAKIVLFFVFDIVIGVAYYRFMLWYNDKVSEDLQRFPLLAFVLCLFLAWAAETWFGVADIIGAFSAGLIVGATPRAGYIESRFSPLSYLLLTPIFFASIGLEVTLPALTPKLALFTVMLVIVGILSKLIGCGLGAKICGFSTHQSVQTGLGMVCRGEVALIVANKGMASGMIQEELFGPIIIMVVACTVATPILLKVAFRGEDSTASLEASRLVDRIQMPGELDAIAAQLVEKEPRHRRHALDIFTRFSLPHKKS